jgi:hypothetical protein
VLVGTLDEDGDGEWILAVLHESELVLPQHVLVHQASISQAALIYVK